MPDAPPPAVPGEAPPANNAQEPQPPVAAAAPEGDEMEGAHAAAERIPLRRSGNDCVVCLNLLPGTYQYKFIVDNEWRFAADQPTVRDEMGNINNIFQISKAAKEDDQKSEDEESFQSTPRIGEGGQDELIRLEALAGHGQLSLADWKRARTIEEQLEVAADVADATERERRQRDREDAMSEHASVASLQQERSNHELHPSHHPVANIGAEMHLSRRSGRLASNSMAMCRHQ